MRPSGSSPAVRLQLTHSDKRQPERWPDEVKACHHEKGGVKERSSSPQTKLRQLCGGRDPSEMIRVGSRRDGPRATRAGWSSWDSGGPQVGFNWEMSYLIWEMSCLRWEMSCPKQERRIVHLHANAPRSCMRCMCMRCTCMRCMRMRCMCMCMRCMCMHRPHGRPSPASGFEARQPHGRAAMRYFGP